MVCLWFHFIVGSNACSSTSKRVLSKYFIENSGVFKILLASSVNSLKEIRRYSHYLDIAYNLQCVVRYPYEQKLIRRNVIMAKLCKYH